MRRSGVEKGEMVYTGGLSAFLLNIHIVPSLGSPGIA